MSGDSRHHLSDQGLGGIYMSKLLAISILCVSILPVCAQNSSQYQPGTITGVKTHQNAPGEPDVARYDVSVTVGDTLYVVLYTPPNGAKTVEYSAGFSILVLVGNDTLTFNSQLSGTTEVPILSRQPVDAQNRLDLAKVPGHYFSMKQQHLSEVLGLTDDQQTQIKPVLEQETGEVGQFVGNPAISRKEKLKRWEKIVRASDEKLKPFLSQSQLSKLQQLRKEQKQDLSQFLAVQQTGRQN